MDSQANIDPSVAAVAVDFDFGENINPSITTTTTTKKERAPKSPCCQHAHPVKNSNLNLCAHQPDAADLDLRRQAAAYEQLCLENKHVPTYSNHKHPATGEVLLGCEHYARNCKIQAPCCGMWVTCRHCHDVDCITATHRIDRFAISTIMCMLCDTQQPVSNKCINESCGVQFAEYYCAACKFFDNTPGKDMYHCDKCGICRVGKREDFWHCDTCQVCISKEEDCNNNNNINSNISSYNNNAKAAHRCFKDSILADCPVCDEYLKTSTKQVILMQCGHGMHLHCFEEYSKINMNCPVCDQTLMET